MSKWRKTTWGIVAWSAVLAVWAASGAMAVTDLVGPVVGFGFILVLWLAGSMVLCTIWLITRRNGRSTS